MEYRLVYQFVWGSMRSKPCLTGRAASRLVELIHEKARSLSIELLQVDVYPDRIYVAVVAPPKLSPHHIVCQFKAHSSRCLRHEYDEMTKLPTLWTRAYLVVAGDRVAPEEVLAAFAEAVPPRRPPGRPRSCGGQ